MPTDFNRHSTPTGTLNAKKNRAHRRRDTARHYTGVDMKKVAQRVSGQPDKTPHIPSQGRHRRVEEEQTNEAMLPKVTDKDTTDQPPAVDRSKREHEPETTKPAPAPYPVDKSVEAAKEIQRGHDNPDDIRSIRSNYDTSMRSDLTTDGPDYGRPATTGSARQERINYVDAVHKMYARQIGLAAMGAYFGGRDENSLTRALTATAVVFALCPSVRRETIGWLKDVAHRSGESLSDSVAHNRVTDAATRIAEGATSTTSKYASSIRRAAFARPTNIREEAERRSEELENNFARRLTAIQHSDDTPMSMNEAAHIVIGETERAYFDMRKDGHDPKQALKQWQQTMEQIRHDWEAAGGDVHDVWSAARDLAALETIKAPRKAAIYKNLYYHECEPIGMRRTENATYNWDRSWTTREGRALDKEHSGPMMPRIPTDINPHQSSLTTKYIDLIKDAAIADHPAAIARMNIAIRCASRDAFGARTGENKPTITPAEEAHDAAVTAIGALTDDRMAEEDANAVVVGCFHQALAHARKELEEDGHSGAVEALEASGTIMEREDVAKQTITMIHNRRYDVALGVAPPIDANCQPIGDNPWEPKAYLDPTLIVAPPPADDNAMPTDDVQAVDALQKTSEPRKTKKEKERRRRRQTALRATRRFHQATTEREEPEF